MMRKRLVSILLSGVLASMAVGADKASNSGPVGLDRIMPAIKLNNVTFREAIDFLRDLSGANIHVNWRAIEAYGVAADTAVSIRLTQVPLRKVLSLILSEASGGSGLTFYQSGKVIEITTTELADQEMLTASYPVQNLLFEPPPFTPPPDFFLATSHDGNGLGYGGQQGRNMGATYISKQSNQPTSKADELIRLITETIRPEIWTQNGGKASIRIFNGNLIVTAPRSVHEAIAGPMN